MNGILLLFLVILILIIMGIIIFVLYELVQKKIENNYKNLMNNLDVSNLKEYKKCPNGCSKGVCNNTSYCSITDMLENKCCNFDIQCHHCLDNNGEYYKYPNNYYEHKKQEVNLQNDIIKFKNKEINEINKIINNINKKIKF